MHRTPVSRGPGRIGRAAAWCLLAMGWSACRLSTSPITDIDLLDIDAAVRPPAVAEPAAGSGEDAAPATAEPNTLDPMQPAGMAGASTLPSAGTSSSPLAGTSGGSASAGATAAAPKPAGQGGRPAPPMAADAGVQPLVDAALPDGTACAFEFAACLAADPLNYDGCTRMHAQHCAVLGLVDAAVPALDVDAALPPSAACAIEQANCIMLHPERANECLLMAAHCAP